MIRLANAAQSNNVYTLTFAAPEGQMAGGAITGVLQGYLPLGQYARGTMWGSPYTDGSTTAGSTPKVLGGFSSTGVSLVPAAATSSMPCGTAKGTRPILKMTRAIPMAWTLSSTATPSTATLRRLCPGLRRWKDLV